MVFDQGPDLGSHLSSIPAHDQGLTNRPEWPCVSEMMKSKGILNALSIAPVAHRPPKYQDIVDRGGKSHQPMIQGSIPSTILHLRGAVLNSKRKACDLPIQVVP